MTGGSWFGSLHVWPAYNTIPGVLYDRTPERRNAMAGVFSGVDAQGPRFILLITAVRVSPLPPSGKAWRGSERVSELPS